MLSRGASGSDVDAICALLGEMHDEVALASIDTDKVRARVVDRVLAKGVCVLCEGNDIVGSIALDTYPLWYSQQVVLQDTWLYIHPDHRSLGAFTMLLRAAKNIAKTMDLPLFICLQAINGHDRKEILFQRYMDQTMKAYRFEPCGGYFQA